MSTPDQMVIAVDSREQRPFRFDNIKERINRQLVPVVVSTVTVALPTADYSIQGLESDVVIERKGSLDELALCCSSERDRFEAELERMAAIPSSHLMLEFSFLDIFEAEIISRISRRSVAGSLTAWNRRYGLNVWFAGSRRAAEFQTFMILDSWWLGVVEGGDLRSAERRAGKQARAFLRPLQEASQAAVQQRQGPMPRVVVV